jgi:DNA polymerase-1
MQRYVDVAGRGKAELPFAEVDRDQAAAYCAADAATVLLLREYFAPRLEETALAPLLADIEMPLVEVLVDMEWAGIAIDRTIFDRLSRELTTDLFRLEAEIAEAAGGSFNLNSPRQLAGILFDKLQLPVIKRSKTGPSTDADVLEQLAAQGHDLPRLLLEYRELEKLRSTYVDVLPARVNRRTGRIHTTFNQTGAATGRLSVSGGESARAQGPPSFVGLARTRRFYARRYPACRDRRSRSRRAVRVRCRETPGALQNTGDFRVP